MDIVKKPSFHFGYYRPWNKDANYFESWLDYNRDNQRSEYVASMIVGGVREINKENINCLREINSTLSDGFIEIQSGLNEIDGTLQIINDTLESGFYELKKNQIKQIQLSVATNILLEDIKTLISFSDSEKERYQFVREGLKFISNVNKDEDYYDDAYRCFSKAVELKSTDYFSLFFLGYISTFNEKHFNPSNAIEFFKKSLKYALIDDDIEIKLLNDFYAKVDGKFSGINLIDSLYLLLSQCYYLIDDSENALKYSLQISEKSFVANFSYQLKYASRINNSEKIEHIVDNIFSKHIENYEDVFGEFDVINNLFTLNTIKNTINNIENAYSILIYKYKNSKEEYEIIQNLKSVLLKDNNVIEKKKIVNYFNDNLIKDEISKQIDFEKMMNSEIDEIEVIYTKYLGIKENYNSAKSELTNKVLKLRKNSDLIENILFNYIKYFIILSVLIVSYVFYKYDIGTAIGYNIVIIICEVILFFIGLFISSIIGRISESVIDGNIKDTEKKSTNLTKSNEAALNNYQKDIKNKKENLQYYIDKHISYNYSKIYQQRVSKIKI
jgi:hypothetical protein